jgi:hypothetical protein
LNHATTEFHLAGFTEAELNITPKESELLGSGNPSRFRWMNVIAWNPACADDWLKTAIFHNEGVHLNGYVRRVGNCG